MKSWLIHFLGGYTFKEYQIVKNNADVWEETNRILMRQNCALHNRLEVQKIQPNLDFSEITITKRRGRPKGNKKKV